MELFIAFLLVVAASYLAFLSSKNEILKGKKISKSGWKSHMEKAQEKLKAREPE